MVHFTLEKVISEMLNSSLLEGWSFLITTKEGKGYTEKPSSVGGLRNEKG